MKASYHGHMFEVDSIIGKDGMEYPAQDVVLIEPDWASFRREAAKDIVCAILSAGMNQTYDNDERFYTFERLAEVSVEWADTLIAKLKEK